MTSREGNPGAGAAADKRCPPAAELLSFERATLLPGKRRKIARHLSVCRECGQEVLLIKEILDEESSLLGKLGNVIGGRPDDAGGKRGRLSGLPRGPGRRLAAGYAGAILAALFFLVLIPTPPSSRGPARLPAGGMIRSERLSLRWTAFPDARLFVGEEAAPAVDESGGDGGTNAADRFVRRGLFAETPGGRGYAGWPTWGVSEIRGGDSRRPRFSMALARAE